MFLNVNIKTKKTKVMFSNVNINTKKMKFYVLKCKHKHKEDESLYSQM